MATRNRSWTLAVVSLATAMLMLDIAVVNTAVSDMGRDLHTSLDGLKWVVDAYTLALAAVVLTTGSLADRLGRKRVFAAGMAVFTLSSAAAAAATDITMLNIIRAVQGLGAAAMFATSMALLAHEFPQAQERVKAPMLPLGLFRVPSFAGAQIAAFSISGSLFAVYIFATIYLQQVLGLSAIEAGLVYLPGTILNAAVSGATANVSGKVTARVM